MLASRFCSRSRTKAMIAHRSAGGIGQRYPDINPVPFVIPCHRVVGKDGTPTGYGGGIWRKQRLLDLERKGDARLFPPER